MYAYKITAIFLSLAIAGPVYAELQELTRETRTRGTVTLKFDDQRIARDVLEKYLLIHPRVYARRFAKTYIARCTDAVIYYPCGTRNLDDYNYLDNAQVNVRRAEKRIQYLKGLNEVPELQPLTSYFEKLLSFSLELDKRVLRYFQNGNVSVLKESVEGLEPIHIVPGVLRKLATVESKHGMYWLARFQWRGAMFAHYKEALGAIPEGSWDAFLEAYDIKESYVPSAR
ncbi:MAG: hypothetical protein BMS9Abin36_0160 [Gammaproteobacteria bacterium]|nr:MAG: hypothetical protein BMS9Abin36_0160 [Gammaproteobacteria bacterium]